MYKPGWAASRFDKPANLIVFYSLFSLWEPDLVLTRPQGEVSSCVAEPLDRVNERSDTPDVLGYDLRHTGVFSQSV